MRKRERFSGVRKRMLFKSESGKGDQECDREWKRGWCLREREREKGIQKWESDVLKSKRERERCSGVRGEEYLRVRKRKVFRI